MPSSAWRIRFFPSKTNGLVTTPTVSAPTSRAIFAITGAPPVPVPPPMPAVMKIMSAPVRYSRSLASSSIAARRPTSGLAPAPRPLVTCSPNWIFTVARFASIACASVLATMKSTPVSLPAIIVLTALPPPPPMPITLMRAPNCTCSTNSNMTPPSPFSRAAPLRVRVAFGRSPRPTPPMPITLMRAPNCTCSTNSNMTPPSPFSRAAPLRVRVAFGRSPRPTPLKEFAQPLRHPALHLAENVVLANAEKVFILSLHAVEHEPDAGRVDGARDHVGESMDVHRKTLARRHAEDFFGHLDHAGQQRRAAGQDDARRKAALVARLHDLAPEKLENLVEARLDDFAENLPRNRARAAAAHRRHFDALVARDHRRPRVAVALLDALGLGDRRAQPGRDVAREIDSKSV